jgi:hypothetical protein
MPSLVHRLDILMPDTDMQSMILTASSGFTFTISVNSHPAAIIGANIMWPGVAQVWAMSSELIRGYGRTFTKMVDELLRQGARVNKLRRYHAIVNGSDMENVRWLYTLNFEYEFCMNSAAPDGSNVFGYVRWEDKNGRRTRQTKTKLREHVDQLLGVAA